jgi:hypothetical protein
MRLFKSVILVILLLLSYSSFAVTYQINLERMPIEDDIKRINSIKHEKVLKISNSSFPFEYNIKVLNSLKINKIIFELNYWPNKENMYYMDKLNFPYEIIIVDNYPYFHEAQLLNRSKVNKITMIFTKYPDREGNIMLLNDMDKPTLVRFMPKSGNYPYIPFFNWMNHFNYNYEVEFVVKYFPNKNVAEYFNKIRRNKTLTLISNMPGENDIKRLNSLTDTQIAFDSSISFTKKEIDNLNKIKGLHRFVVTEDVYLSRDILKTVKAVGAKKLVLSEPMPNNLMNELTINEFSGLEKDVIFAIGNLPY